MPRGIPILVVAALLLGGVLYFLSTRASEVPTKTIEVDVAAPANAS